MGDLYLRDKLGMEHYVMVPDNMDDFARKVSDNFEDAWLKQQTDLAEVSTSEANFNDLNQRLVAFEAIMVTMAARIQYLEERLKESMPLLF